MLQLYTEILGVSQLVVECGRAKVTTGGGNARVTPMVEGGSRSPVILGDGVPVNAWDCLGDLPWGTTNFENVVPPGQHSSLAYQLADFADELQGPLLEKKSQSWPRSGCSVSPS